ncbi:MAG: hypothetical protein ACRDQ0_15845 [Pseudonocardia sp.]
MDTSWTHSGARYLHCDDPEPAPPGIGLRLRNRLIELYSAGAVVVAAIVVWDRL